LGKYGKWEIESSLSEGGQGRTFIVYDESDSKKSKFVLKRLKDVRRLGRFKDEVRAGLQFNHRNIARIVDYDLDSEKPYLVTEFYGGGTLLDLDLNKFTGLDRLRMFEQISDAVWFAHSNSPTIIHRDLKPENIFIKDDGVTPVVGDFGICFIDDQGERFTLLDEAVGARRYTAPEIEDGRLDLVQPAADVYSLGKLLYFMLARQVFSREQHREPRWDLTKLGDDNIYHFVNDLLDRMIVADPGGRLPQAGQVSDEVRTIIRLLEAGGHPLDFSIPQQCAYCANGHYEKFFETDRDGRITQMPFNYHAPSVPMDINKWQQSRAILVCDNCGHEQTFRPMFKGSGKSLWKNYPPKGST
jgi:serine/threonine protein kinase